MKTRTVLAILSLLVIAMMLAGCKAEPEVLIGAKANNTAVTINNDQTLAVYLESNVTTGYSWGIAECDETVLKSQGDPEYVEGSRAKDLVGASGAEILRFKPVAAGTTHLKLIYRRPWEKDVEPVNSFDVEITVQ